MIFKGRAAVITAGANGIGRSVSEGLLRRGMNVLIADIDGQAAQRAAALGDGERGRCLGMRCDVRDEADLAAVRDTAMREFGAVDLLMNHAGLSLGGPVEQIPITEWASLLDLNVLGMVRALRVFLPGMLSAGSGHLVFTTSSLALIGGHPRSRHSVPYITSKTAVIGLAQAVDRYVRPRGIGVTLFAPDYTDTAFPRTGRRIGEAAGDAPPIAATVPYPPQTPKQAADVLFAALDANSFLASATPDHERLLAEQARAKLDPGALTAHYHAFEAATGPATEPPSR